MTYIEKKIEYISNDGNQPVDALFKRRTIVQEVENIASIPLFVDCFTTPIINEESEKQPSKIQLVTSCEFNLNSLEHDPRKRLQISKE